MSQSSVIHKILNAVVQPVFNVVIRPAIDEAFKETNQKLDQVLGKHGVDSSTLKLGHKIDALIALLKDKKEDTENCDE